jgi:hypothetical protein
MKGVTKVMGQMNRKMNLPQISKIMMDFERQNETMSERRRGEGGQGQAAERWGGGGKERTESASGAHKGWGGSRPLLPVKGGARRSI